MVAYRILFLAGAVAALPLNINLGAYSPALVVGMMRSLARYYSMCMQRETDKDNFTDHGVRQQVMVKLALEVIKMYPGS